MIGGEGSDTADFSDIDVPVTVTLDANGNGIATRDTGFTVTVTDAQVSDDAVFVEQALAGNIYFNVHTCLLYTSPSPRDQRGSRMPSSA